MAGSAPTTASDVNVAVGSLCRQLVGLQAQFSRFQTYMAATDLTAAPISMTSADQATIKSAISGANTALAAMSMTFVNQLTGPF